MTEQIIADAPIQINIDCKRCRGQMRPGQAMVSTLRGLSDFAGTRDVVTVSPGGTGRLIECRKCADCGWSTTA